MFSIQDWRTGKAEGAESGPLRAAGVILQTPKITVEPLIETADFAIEVPGNSEGGKGAAERLYCTMLGFLSEKVPSRRARAGNKYPASGRSAAS
jgi:hypothetical protein